MKILVAVIAYNEEGNIEDVLMDLITHNFGYDIVVIDNGSHDKTTILCKKLKVDIISHCINTGGFNGAFLSYFLYAYRHNYDIVCQFDGDGQHCASELPKIITPLQHNEADCVIGSRFLEKRGFQSYFFRRIGIRFFSFLHSRITGQKFTDITSGFRSYNRKLIDFYGNFGNVTVHDVINQFVLYSYFIHARIIEVPVLMKARMYGQSEYHLWNAVFFPVKGLVSILGCLLQREHITRKQQYLYEP